ncbi:MAG: hydroxymethylglutaryl-CoA reductase, degradative [Flavobacteriaceae bacterium]|jgi:hydroxymethylglutaryl-CoA reductase|nr:hydroxymethylglutaryl-CoA reductase, degradative [Flavobacteriaceae bacterium]NVJ73399.1 hydroxymethylglutaryl-CoA reductase, degradative [Flavobacteriaceae bacterium]
MSRSVEGFSKWTKEEKIAWVAKNYTHQPDNSIELIKNYWNSDEQLQQLHDEFIENTISNYYLPLGIAPNFLIDGTYYAIPMAIEESSVVAAASKAAKYWSTRGGFTTEILGTEKIGQVHFLYPGEKEKLTDFFNSIKEQLVKDCKPLTANMEKRGGGLSSIELKDKTHDLQHYYQLHCTFETADAMGANFINSCLEQLSKTLEREAINHHIDVEVVMSILSNYVPNCIVRAKVSCPIDELGEIASVPPREFAKKMIQAVSIAKASPYRAVTHNKGIMNGIDAVVIATGNDFRAIEAAAHAYASKDGQYSSLSHAEINGDQFSFWMDIPLAVGTVGGLTKLHPLVKLALEILQNPSAKDLMRIIAVAGLAQNFAAVKSLVTTGIQQGHMKMHLLNILNQLGATVKEKELLSEEFKNKTVSFSNVSKALIKLRS